MVDRLGKIDRVGDGESVGIDSFASASRNGALILGLKELARLRRVCEFVLRKGCADS